MGQLLADRGIDAAGSNQQLVWMSSVVNYPKSLPPATNHLSQMSGSGFFQKHPWIIHVMLLLIVLIYAACGGFIFSQIEEHSGQRNYNDDLNFTYKCIRKVLNFTRLAGDEEMASLITRECFEKRFEIVPWNFHMSMLYSFTIMTTVGYGPMTPSTVSGRIFCIIFVVIGIPLTMLSLADFGKFISSAVCNGAQKLKHKWHEMRKAKNTQEAGNSPKKEGNQPDEEEEEEEVHPTGVNVLLGFFGYVLFGGIMVQIIEGDRFSFLDGIFYIFMWITAIDVASIGAGNPVFLAPKLIYAIFGLALATIAIEVGSEFLQKLHWFGRKPAHLENVKIWFGGQQVSVKYLTRSLGRKLGVDPETLENQVDLEKLIHRAIAEQNGLLIPFDLYDPVIRGHGTYNPNAVNQTIDQSSIGSFSTADDEPPPVPPYRRPEAEVHFVPTF